MTLAPGGERAEVHAIFADVLDEDVEDVPDDVPLLELISSSLAVLEISRRILDRWDVAIPVSTVLDGKSTIETLAALLERASGAAHDGEGVDDPDPVEVLELGAWQDHVAFLMRYSSEASAAYNEAVGVRLRGRLDVAALQTALVGIAAHRDVLRAALPADGRVLELRREIGLRLPATAVAADELQARLEAVAARPFAEGEPLFRAELLALAPTEHVLVMVGHALVVDRHGLELVVEELGTAYAALTAVREVTLAPAIGLRDYLERRMSAASPDAAAAAVHYWSDAYPSAWPELDLPSDRRRPPIKGYAGRRRAVAVTDVPADRLDAASLPAQALAAYTMLLHRLGRREDIVVGIETGPLLVHRGERVLAAAHDILPVRSRYDPGRAFGEHVAEIASSLDDSTGGLRISLAELIRALGARRDQSRSALFTAALRVRGAPAPPQFGPVDASWESLPTAYARYDLDLTVEHGPDGVALMLDYSTELFEEPTVDAWLCGLAALWRAGLDRPETPCRALPLLADRDRTLVLDAWNATERAFPLARTALDLLDDAASAQPDAVATRCAASSLSYRELLARVDELAQRLLVAGVRHGDRVGILLPRSTDLLASLLACWRVGAAYVPIDPGLPAKRIAFIARDAECRAVVTAGEVAAMVADVGGTSIVRIDALAPEGPTPRRESRATPAGPDDMAYLIYTSGSTGRPKGVQVPHRSLLNVLLATLEVLGSRAAERLLATTPISFDISVVELFMPLIAGGMVDIAPRELADLGTDLAGLIDERAPSYVQATPSTWKALLAHGWGGRPDAIVGAAGEPLTPDLARALRDRVAGVYNLYGPTEATVYATAHRVTADTAGPVPIGRPLANVRAYVLDGEQQPVPVCAVGELHIGGEAVATGYWRRDELTRERFVADPFRPGGRVYRTGDLAYYRPTGELVCIGRSDSQVKVRGVRLELGEVEAALHGLPAVSEAAVTTWSDEHDDLRLVAHVVTTDASTTAADVRAGLREQLPATLIPGAILIASSIPRLASGKVDRKRLPSPRAGRHTRPVRGNVGPATATERLLAGMWSRLLGINDVRRNDDFLELGGHSLLMTQLRTDVRQVFGVTLTMRELFAVPTLLRLGALVDERRAALVDSDRDVGDEPRSSSWARQRMDYLRREAELPRDVGPARGLVFETAGAPRSALVTGVTGFVGAYVVGELLARTDLEIHCLVRSRPGAGGEQRLRDALASYGRGGAGEAWEAAWRQRVRVLEGDVLLPRFGLTDASYETLARTVDCVLHAAAQVNFVFPYEALRATNVLGLHEVIRFAFHGRIKPLHYVSTAAIWPMGARRTFREDDPLDHGEALNLGYDESKWVAERTLLHAADRGLPVARYRPGEVGGDSRTGQCVLNHFVIAAFKSFLEYGAFPMIDGYLDVAPVDYVAKAIAQLVGDGRFLGRAFHLTNPGRCHVSEAYAFLEDEGYAFDLLPWPRLREEMFASDTFARGPLAPFQGVLEDMDERGLELPDYDVSGTREALAGSDVTCPAVDRQLLRTYLRYLQDVGFVAQPRLAVPLDAGR
jgi:myxalamid-type nonribosomal peptide synthetase MxaA